MKSKVLLSAFIFAGNLAWAVSAPNPSLTPGEVCTSSDPNFDRYDYPEHVARCKRNIMTPEKQEVAKAYGNIPQSEWPKYEFDHLIPLCAGGSNDPKNLWPQPIAEAHQKDSLETSICVAMQAGTMTQAQAIAKVHAWFGAAGVDTPMMQTLIESSMINCVEAHPTDPAKALTAHFDVIDNSHISNVSLALYDGAEHEFMSSEKSVQGQSTRTTKGPLAGLMHYSMKSNNDRFYLYLSADLSGKLVAYVKIAYEDTYPNLTQLDCKHKGSGLE